MKFLIDFIDNATEQDIEAYLAEHNCSVVSVYSAFEKVYLVEANAQPPAASIVEAVVNDDESEIDLLSDTVWSTTSDDDWWKVYSAIKPDLESPTNVHERPVVESIVYLVDSGIDASHAELQGARISQLFSFNSDFTDTKGHGTALASVMVGDTCGIVDVPVKSVKIFQEGVATKLSDLLNAFEAISLDGAQHPNNMKIVNMSWIVEKSEYLEQKIREFMDLGYVVVCSAGNDGSPIADVIPASIDDAITVGAYNQDFKPCTFSNFTGYLDTSAGPVNYGALDVWAPGENIRVAKLGGGTAFINGTSIAAAIQTAVIAFNSQYFALSDGSLLSLVQNRDTLVEYSSGKDGILILDEQHADSVNIVSRLLSERLGENGLNAGTPTKLTWRLVSGVELPGVYALSPYTIKSIGEYELPEGLYFDNGWLRGTVNVETETIYEITIPITYYNDVSIDYKLKLAVSLPTTDVNDPNLGEEVRIVLTAPGDCDPYGMYCSGTCSGTPGKPNCLDCGGLFKIPECTCTGWGCE